jgi:hypothetical protein
MRPVLVEDRHRRSAAERQFGGLALDRAEMRVVAAVIT